jgi:probable DNA metabolism protein
VPPAFVELAKAVVLNRASDRFELLYRLLWRLRETPRLLGLSTDPDAARARDMAKAVSRAAHKMKAFVRFRPVTDGEAETFVAWFEPAHRVVERTSTFFRDRFANQRFSILTPDECCHWDGRVLAFTPGVARIDLPGDDFEAAWLTYFASIFNPARLKVAAMTSEMPRRYWRNLPEAALIADLIASAEARSVAMIAKDPSHPRRRLPPRRAHTDPGSPDGAALETLADEYAGLQACRRCELWKDATQGVAGAGPPHAPLMLVGEQPGDQEDLAGAPFVGPAGQLLDRALAAAGIPREAAFVTNAVKHFKHELRGKRRLHRTPDAGEVRACRWWLDQERRLVRPRLIVALGGTAALAVFGRAMPILKSRGAPLSLEGGGQGMVTVHPSYLLRLPDAAAKAQAWTEFVADLAVARELIA